MFIQSAVDLFEQNAFCSCFSVCFCFCFWKEHQSIRWIVCVIYSHCWLNYGRTYELWSNRVRNNNNLIFIDTAEIQKRCEFIEQTTTKKQLRTTGEKKLIHIDDKLAQSDMLHFNLLMFQCFNDSMLCFGLLHTFRIVIH